MKKLHIIIGPYKQKNCKNLQIKKDYRMHYFQIAYFRCRFLFIFLRKAGFVIIEGYFVLKWQKTTRLRGISRSPNT